MEKKRSSKKLGASVLAILLVISMMVGMVPGGMSEVHAADAKANVKAEEQTGFLDKAKDFFSDMGEVLLRIPLRISDVSGRISLYITVMLHFRELEKEDKRFRLQSRKLLTLWLDCLHCLLHPIQA